MAEHFAPLDEIIDYDPLTGVSQRMVMETDGTLRLITDQNLEPFTRVAHESRMNRQSRHEKMGEMCHIASIPVSIQYDLITRGIWQDRDRFKRWLNSDEAKPFRTHWARV